MFRLGEILLRGSQLEVADTHTGEMTLSTHFRLRRDYPFGRRAPGEIRRF